MTIDQVKDHSTIEIDALGKPCPMPLLMLKRAIKSTTDAQYFHLKASDPNSEVDILRYCQLNHLSCEMTQISENEFQYWIKI